MSGIKEATVQETLGRVVDTVRKAAAESERIARMAAAVGSVECKRRASEAERVHAGLRRTLPAELAKWLVGETERWEKLLRKHDKSHEAGKRLVNTAREKEAEFYSYRNNRMADLSGIEGEVWRLEAEASRKRWYLSAEDSAAQALRSRAEEVLSTMRRGVSIGERVQEVRRDALARFADAEGLAQEAEREYDRIVSLAEARRERQRIAEENERMAEELADALKSLRKAIESKNVAKFNREAYPYALQKETQEVLSLAGNGKYEEALERGAGVKVALEEAVEKIATAEREQAVTRLTAERALADAREETRTWTPAELAKDARVATAVVERAFRELDAAENELAAGRYADVPGAVAAAMEKLRAWAARAAEGRRLSQRREEMAEAIWTALEESGYEGLTARYEGNGRETLRLTAVSGDGIGDVEMRMGLDGRTKFEVKGIPVGEEALCHDRVRAWADRLAAMGVAFEVTDWGRAEQVARERTDSSEDPPEGGGARLTRNVSRNEGTKKPEAWT